jgi:hypothetical protein
VVTIDTPDGHAIKGYIGGRDDAFFNDLPGFFRSINYAPQFYHVPHTMTDLRELKIPKTLIELEGNHLFNFDPANPDHGRSVKLDLPDGPLTWSGDRFFKDENGNYRFVYSGQDAQAGRNVNAIILEIPLSFITREPEKDRVVDVWGESWVLKASSKVETIPDDPFWLEHPWVLLDAFRLDDELKRYKLVDTVGRAAVRGRRPQRARGQPPAWGQQLLAGAAVRQAAGAPRLGLRAVDHRPGARDLVRPRQLTGLDPQDVRAGDRGVPAREEDAVPAASNAGRQLEQARAGHPAAAAVRGLRAERLRH